MPVAVVRHRLLTHAATPLAVAARLWIHSRNVDEYQQFSLRRLLPSYTQTFLSATPIIAFNLFVTDRLGTQTISINCSLSSHDPPLQVPAHAPYSPGVQ